MKNSEKINFEDKVIVKIKNLIIETICSAQKDINPDKRRNHFELLDYEFLIDEDLQVWLLEINTNPNMKVYKNHI